MIEPSAWPGTIQIGAATVRPSELQFDDVGMKAAVFAAVGVAAQADAQSTRRGRTHQGGIVPGQRRDRLGQFLEPAVVGEAAIVDGRVRLE